MPRFYVFSFILSVLIGLVMCRIVETRSPNLLTVSVLTLLALALFINEKKAILENRLGKKSRQALAVVGVAALAVLWILVLMQLGLIASF